MITWSEKLELGIEIIDGQHKQILMETNKLLEAFEQGKEQEQAFETLCFIEDYVNKHFKAEEFYLEKFEYEDRINHIKLHREFSKKLEEFKSAHKRSGITKIAAKEMGEFLINWWFFHIQNVDSKYVELIAPKINKG